MYFGPDQFCREAIRTVDPLLAAEMGLRTLTAFLVFQVYCVPTHEMELWKFFLFILPAWYFGFALLWYYAIILMETSSDDPRTREPETLVMKGSIFAHSAITVACAIIYFY